MTARKLIAFAAFVSVVVAANALTAKFGIVTWLGLAATAGTWIAGFGFVARDYLHEVANRRWIIAAILTGAALSAVLSPQLAVASAAAFLLSEFADYAVYSPLRQRSRTLAAILSNTVGAVVDTVVFLALAGFPLSGTFTQVIIKVGTTTLLVLAVRGSGALLRQPNGPTRGETRDA